MEFISKEIDDYACNYTDAEDPVLYELNRATNQKILQPRMLSGHLQGKILEMFSKMIQPRFILEIGTYTGYSAICLAKGLQSDGKLLTIDVNEELEDFTRSFFEKAGITNQVDFRIDNALNVIDGINDPIDLVFIDADKENYAAYFDLVIDKVRPGGYIIADNVLWSGKVVQELDPKDKETKGIIAYAEKVKNDARVENVLMPVRDGLLISRKL
jgi:caffeoyl-CoA O-methyltransferase